MNQQQREEIQEGALNYWIEYNRKVAKGIYYGEEWLDDGTEVKEFSWYGNKVMPVWNEGRKVVSWGGVGIRA